MFQSRVSALNKFAFLHLQIEEHRSASAYDLALIGSTDADDLATWRTPRTENKNMVKDLKLVDSNEITYSTSSFVSAETNLADDGVI